MKHQFDAFIDDLKATHGKNLASVILYGSAAAGDFVPRQSDYNLLIALHRITPKDLRNANACIREWSKFGNSTPVYFTVSELQNAADVFPIEFHNMERARRRRTIQNYTSQIIAVCRSQIVYKCVKLMFHLSNLFF